MINEYDVIKPTVDKGKPYIKMDALQLILPDSFRVRPYHSIGHQYDLMANAHDYYLMFSNEPRDGFEITFCWPDSGKCVINIAKIVKEICKTYVTQNVTLTEIEDNDDLLVYRFD